MKSEQHGTVQEFPDQRVKGDQQVYDRQREEADVGGLGKTHPQEHRDVCRVGEDSEERYGACEEMVIDEGDDVVDTVADQRCYGGLYLCRRVDDAEQIFVEDGRRCGHVSDRMLFLT